MTSIETYEQAILELVARVLRDEKGSLDRAGLEAKAPSLSIDLVEEDHRTSEVIVRFLAESDTVDVIEFHVYRSGKAVASERETEAWLRENLQDVVRRRSGKA